MRKKWGKACTLTGAILLSQNAYASECASNLKAEAATLSSPVFVERLMQCLIEQQAEIANLKKTDNSEEHSHEPKKHSHEHSHDVVGVPSGAIIAAKKACRNLKGDWTEFEDARGRMIIGANPNGTYGYKPRQLGESGGQEEVTLTDTQMPKHSHGFVGALSGQPLQWYQSQKSYAVPAADGQKSIDWSAGGVKSHENMPPYIALYFCVKD